MFAKQKLSEVPLNKLAVICHKDDVEVVNDMDSVMEITPELTLAIAEKFTDGTWAKAQQDEDFKSRIGMIFPDIDIGKIEKLADCPIGFRHVVGLIVGTNMAINKGMSPFWRTPEVHLHPSTQAKLADLAVRYSNEFGCVDP